MGYPESKLSLRMDKINWTLLTSSTAWSADLASVRIRNLQGVLLAPPGSSQVEGSSWQWAFILAKHHSAEGWE